MGMLVKVVVVGGTGSNSGFQKLSDPKNVFRKDTVKNMLQGFELEWNLDISK